ncbi:Hypothetical protein SMAX5B_010006 [Scophthalmus maximus]|uniref:Uncharacterized protein n=1 Tax=Scophthalmus maximus TaxID=52904 RepID=A0A2U9BY81_SCOMX|nr:Hypothetical protein SMAX5B_010006 [Scophthalmus maximus]
MHGACPPVRAALQTDAWSSPSSHFAKPSVLWSERARAPPVGNSSRLTCSLHQRKVRRSHVVRVAAAAPTATSSETVRLGTRRPKRDDACAQCADECKGARARGETGLIQDQSGGLTSPVSETSQVCDTWRGG